MKLTLQHHFDSAHRLELHKGACKNLHGHRWEVLVEIEANLKDDMIVDFGDLKDIINKYDHACILKQCLENITLLPVLEIMGMKVIKLDVSPTAENLVKILHEEIKNDLLRKITSFTLEITLWESPKAGVVYNGL